MIIINDYNIELVELTYDKIELVRTWRNSDDISKYMGFRGYITEKMQDDWFSRMRSSGNNFYFIIKSNNKETGLVNIKDIDWNSRIGEIGIFIWDKDCLHVGDSYRAYLCLQDFAFNVLHMDSIKAHILNANPRSIKFHERFGYKLIQVNNTELSEHNDIYLLESSKYKAIKKSMFEFLISKYNFTPSSLHI